MRLTANVGSTGYLRAVGPHRGTYPNGIKLGKAQRGGQRIFRYSQFNNFVILTLFRA